jgi:hypothetical protein
MPWPWLFLGVTLVGAWFTFNAYLPHRRLGPLTVPSFFAGWLTSELSAHHFAWQLAATVFFVWMGALEAWPGWLGLGITLASWVGLLAMVPVSGRAKDVVEDARPGGKRAARTAAEPLPAPRSHSPAHRRHRLRARWALQASARRLRAPRWRKQCTRAAADPRRRLGDR